MEYKRISVLASLLGLSLLAAPALAVDLDRADYPDKGKAIEEAKFDSDYSDLLQTRQRALAIMRARGHGFVPSPELHGYVKGVLTKLLAGISLPPSFQPDVRILATPEFDALCTPDGTIIISTGALLQLSNEDELAFVLAHEVSHALHRHHDSEWFTRTQYFAVVNATALEEMSGKLQFATSNINMGNLSRDIAIARRFYEFSSNVLAPQFQQDQEDEADALGFDLMVKAGYDPGGAATLLEKLQAAEEAAERAAEAAKDGKRSQSSSSSSDLFGSLGNLTNLAFAVADLALDNLSEDSKAHRAASDRIELISAYQFREYRDAVPVEPQPLPWQKMPSSPLALLVDNYKSADALYDYANGAESGGNAGRADIESAARKAVTSPTKNHAYTEFAVARYARQAGKSDAVHAALLGAVKSPEPSWIAYSTLIDDDMSRQEYQAADSVMGDAVGRFENSPVLLPKNISIKRALGQDGEVQRLLGQCDGYDIKELHQKCKDAAGSG